MNYQQFVTNVKEKVSLFLDSNMHLEIHTTLKNNGRERVGLTISDNRTNIFPTIYLEEYYLQFQNGNTIDAIAESILNVYHEVKFEHVWKADTIKDFQTAQTMIVYKLIHTERNKNLLQTIPHIPYLDLTIAFYVLYEVDEAGIATIPITNELARFWNTNSEELYRIAKENTKQLLPASFKPIRIVIEELLGNTCDNEILTDDIMFVLTNSLRNFGAACLLYDEVLEQISGQLGESFFILPSSIHEVIIVPESQSPLQEYLNDMITEINETQVDVEEVLSEHAYHYDYATQTLS